MCGFRRGNGTRAASGFVRIMSERSLDIVEELCAFIMELCAFIIDWQKEFDHVDWSKLMQMLEETGIDWCERRLNGKLYMEQSVKKYD